MVRKSLIVVLVMALVTMACSFSIGSTSFSIGSPPEPTPEPPPVQPTRTIEPTPTLEPTPEPTEEPAEAPLPTMAVPTESPEEIEVDEPVVDEPEPFFIEEFEDGDGWVYFLMSGDEDDMVLEADSDRLVFNLDGEEIYAYVLYDEYIYTDVGIEAVAENRGVNSNNVSLLCRYSDDEGWYEFNIGSDGLYNILRFDQRRGEYVLLASGGSNSINMGKAVNVYTATCKGEKLTLWINGREIKQIEDASLREGQVGISVSSFDQYPVIVEFDTVEIFQP